MVTEAGVQSLRVFLGRVVDAGASNLRVTTRTTPEPPRTLDSRTRHRGLNDDQEKPTPTDTSAGVVASHLVVADVPRAHGSVVLVRDLLGERFQ
jgi:hypothetical protein